ncbi:hypothetical protein [Variovorax sp. PBS-H4]|uniref:hypothetical protein n=1 Tax=Variovorax sp. PBS-H4 TaxID=434008 RepID=UPI0013A555D6|nr:hypothetical protein [Variovorax sp. PBS-H4]
MRRARDDPQGRLRLLHAVRAPGQLLMTVPALPGVRVVRNIPGVRPASNDPLMQINLPQPALS